MDLVMGLLVVALSFFLFAYVAVEIHKRHMAVLHILWVLFGWPISFMILAWIFISLGIDISSGSSSDGPHCYDTYRGPTCDYDY